MALTATFFMLNPSDRLSVHPAMYAKPTAKLHNGATSGAPSRVPAPNGAKAFHRGSSSTTVTAKQTAEAKNITTQPPRRSVCHHGSFNDSVDSMFVSTFFGRHLFKKKKREGGCRGPSECLPSRLNFSQPLPNICQIYTATTRLPPDFCERQTYPRTRVLLQATQILFESNTEDYRWRILSRTFPGYLEKQSHTLRVK